MSLRICPIAPVHAPIGQVWRFLSRPASFALWWDGKTRSIEPDGEAQPGQRIHATSNMFGIPYNVDVLVERIDEPAHTLDVMTTLPLGIIIFSHVTCKELDAVSCQISFGSEFSFSPVWWGWVLEQYASQQLYRGVASALLRLKTTLEAAP